MKSPFVLAIAMLPPPIHGASTISLAIIGEMRSRGANVVAVNIVPGFFSRFFGGIFWRLLKMAYSIFLFFYLFRYILRKPTSVYLTPSGGVGQFIDCLLAVPIRCMRCPVFLHHHSFAYVNKSSRIFSLLLYILGSSRTTHIVLCEEMANKLCDYKYGINPDNIFLLSNAFHVIGKKNAKEMSGLKVIGFIGNVTVEKGISEFIEVYRACINEGINCRGLVAGPLMSSEVESLVLSAAKENSGFEYLGSVYGEKKADFYRAIDVLVFPTKYANEAEPMVIYEAAFYGVPTVAYARGCISSMVGHCGGYVIGCEDVFIAPAVDFIRRCGSPEYMQSRSLAALEGAEFLSGISQPKLNLLFDRMTVAY